MTQVVSLLHRLRSFNSCTCIFSLTVSSEQTIYKTLQRSKIRHKVGQTRPNVDRAYHGENKMNEKTKRKKEKEKKKEIGSRDRTASLPDIIYITRAITPQTNLITGNPLFPLPSPPMFQPPFPQRKIATLRQQRATKL